jgi:hypothetical protein
MRPGQKPNVPAAVVAAAVVEDGATVAVAAVAAEIVGVGVAADVAGRITVSALAGTVLLFFQLQARDALRPCKAARRPAVAGAVATR